MVLPTQATITLLRMMISDIIIAWLHKTQLTAQLVSSPASSFITLGFVYTLIFIVVYEFVLYAGESLGLWNVPAREVFTDVPVHCAHVYVTVRCGPETLRYHFEFGPDDYESEEYGTTLRHLRNKVLNCCKDLGYSKIESVEIRKKGRLLDDDKQFLCKLGVDTGDKLDCVAS